MTDEAALINMFHWCWHTEQHELLISSSAQCQWEIISVSDQLPTSNTYLKMTQQLKYFIVYPKRNTSLFSIITKWIFIKFRLCLDSETISDFAPTHLTTCRHLQANVWIPFYKTESKGLSLKKTKQINKPNSEPDFRSVPHQCSCWTLKWLTERSCMPHKAIWGIYDPSAEFLTNTEPQ